MTYLLTDDEAAKVRDALLNELCYLQICDAHEKSLTMNKEAIAILHNAHKAQLAPLTAEQLAYVRSALWAVRQYGNIFRYERHQVSPYEKIVKALEICDAAAGATQKDVTGKGKEFSELLKHRARNIAFSCAGVVDMSSLSMREMFALIDEVCIYIDSPPAGAAQKEQT